VIKAIIFDCFGVLTTDNWKAFMAGLSLNQQQPVLDLNQARDANMITQQAFIKGIVALTGHQPQAIEAIFEVDYIKNYQLLNYLSELKPNYRLGLLSNVATNWIRETFLSPLELMLFDATIFSFEVKLAKPDERIFRLAADQLSVAPAECIFIDDTQRNTTAAQGVGMHTVLYQDFKQMQTELEQQLVSRFEK
jgi:epoxide hydrolase-like predicted phosphatase